jgi:hypothetical protein
VSGHCWFKYEVGTKLEQWSSGFTHFRMRKMRTLARSHWFWQGIDDDIDKTVKKYGSCCLVQRQATKIPVHSWEFPSESERVHITRTHRVVSHNLEFRFHKTN